jgi:hypothetical protein
VSRGGIYLLKHIVWNKVSLKLPENWEITGEGGSSIIGTLIAAPESGAKFEVYWRRTSSKDFPKAYDNYVKKLVKKGYEKRNRFSLTIRGHRGLGDYLRRDDVKVFTASWYCSETNRLFITQLDGEKASLGLFSDLLNNVNCHPIINGMVEWRLMGIGLKLYEDYFITNREFKIGYSMSYFLSRDKKVHVIQFSIAKYVLESMGFNEEKIINKHLKLLLPRFTKLVEDRNNSIGDIKVYMINHSIINKINYGVLVKRIINCDKPLYKQYTLIKAPSKRLGEALEIARSCRCVEW